MSTDDLKVRDIVFPLILAEQTKVGESKMVAFLGTGFLIGSEGYALTAAHVVDIKVEANQAIVALFVNKETNKWEIFNADKADTHPTGDKRRRLLLRLPIRVVADPETSHQVALLLGRERCAV